MVRPRRALMALASALLLAFGVGNAYAGRVSMSNQSFRMTWSSFEFMEGTEAISCPLTLEGTFNARTIAKVAGATVGSIVRAAEGSCVGGESTLLTETLPWTIRYGGFSGTLPAITGINLSFVGIPDLIRRTLIRCLYTFPAEAPGGMILNREAGGAITSVRIDETIAHTMAIRLEILCRRFLGVRGTGTFTLQGGATRVTVTLI